VQFGGAPNLTGLSPLIYKANSQRTRQYNWQAKSQYKSQRVLGVPASFWNDLERNYKEALARLRKKKKLLSQVD
jgi:hypothetical protein